MPAITMTIDPDHSSVEFAATYAMNSIIKGRFRRFDGVLVIDTDNPAHSSVSIRIEAGSVDTGNEERDEHLRSADFLDADSHDELTFESTSVEAVDGNHLRIRGELTIGGTTRQTELDTHYYGIVRDARGITRAGFVAETDITRSDWGLTWNEEQDTGVLVSDRVRVSLYISAIPDEQEADQGADETSELE